MLNSLLTQPLLYVCLSTILVGIAIYLAPTGSIVKKAALATLSQRGKAGVYFPLLTSIVVSFVLTLVLKIFQN